MRQIWRRPLSGATILFLLNRYIAVLQVIIGTIWSFAPSLSSHVRCLIPSSYHSIISIRRSDYCLLVISRPHLLTSMSSLDSAVCMRSYRWEGASIMVSVASTICSLDIVRNILTYLIVSERTSAISWYHMHSTREYFSVILMLRVFALWDRNRYVLALLATLWLLQVALGGNALAYSRRWFSRYLPTPFQYSHSSAVVDLPPHIPGSKTFLSYELTLMLLAGCIHSGFGRFWGMRLHYNRHRRCW